MSTDSSLHPALTAGRATTSASVSASLFGTKGKESLPTGLEGLSLLQPITTTAISHLAFTLTNKRRTDLLRSRSCAVAPFSSFVWSNCHISPFARLSSTSWIDIIYLTSSSSASIFVFGAYINDFYLRTGVALLIGEYQRIAF